MKRLGCVQGRLSNSPNGELQFFPEDWKKEFKIADNIGLDFIELFVERKHNEFNPIWSSSGRKELITSFTNNNLNIYSSCIDYIIDHYIFETSSIEYLKNFISCSIDLGCQLIVIPLLEKSDLNEENDELFVDLLNKLAIEYENDSILFAIESVADSKHLYELSKKFISDSIGFVFDTGNRAVFTESLYDEILLLSDKIFHIHLKDKNRFDENVILGNGLVNFDEVFAALDKINYKGNFVFESNKFPDPKRNMQENIALIKKYI